MSGLFSSPSPPPPPAPPPPPPTRAESAPAEAAAKKKEVQQRYLGKGKKSTILTGPKGLKDEAKVLKRKLGA